MFKIKTEILRDMLNKAFKICDLSAARTLPIAGLMEIEFTKEGISVKTTDNITTLIISEKVEGLIPARVTVDANIITSLVNKITTEEIELTINENSLMIVGNGVYNLEIRVDESGEVIKLPTIEQELINSANKEFDFKGIIDRLNICSSAIAQGLDSLEMGNYYLKDIIATTDQQKMCAVTNSECMKEEELFLRAKFGFNLMQLGFTKANFTRNNEKLIIVGENFVISTFMYLDELDMFKNKENAALLGIRYLIGQEFDNKVKIKKADIIGLLDRLSLFIGQYDSNNITLTFLENEVKVTNRNGTCDEVLQYQEDKVIKVPEYTVVLNIENLKQLLAVLPNEVIEIQFQIDSPGVKIIDGDIIQIISIGE